MNTSDDDENDATPEERAAAKRLGDALDSVLGGAAAPAAMDVEERELLELATAIQQGGHSPASFDVEGFLDGVLGTNEKSRFPRLSRRRQPVAAWTIAAVAVAAAVLLYIRGPRDAETAGVAAVDPSDERIAWSANHLIGPISRPAAAEARTRIDTIYAASLGDYRRDAFRGRWRTSE